MWIRSVILAIGAVAALATTALAAQAVTNPTSLILHRADFPAAADYDWAVGEDSGITDALKANGIKVQAASYLGMTYSPTKGGLKVSGGVIALGSDRIAKRAFALAKKQRDSFWKRIGERTTPITVPLYGQQQFARLDPFDSTGIGTIELLVRRNTVLWLLTVNLERRPAPKTAELLRYVKTYALKQKARVGAG